MNEQAPLSNSKQSDPNNPLSVPVLFSNEHMSALPAQNSSKTIPSNATRAGVPAAPAPPPFSLPTAAASEPPALPVAPASPVAPALPAVPAPPVAPALPVAPIKPVADKEVELVTVHYKPHPAPGDKAPVYLEVRKLSKDLPPALFQAQITEAMRIDYPAQLVWSTHGITGKKEPPQAFNTDEQVEYAIEKVLGAQRRSRGCPKGLEVTDVTPGRDAHDPRPMSPVPKSSKRKRSKSPKSRKRSKKAKSKKARRARKLVTEKQAAIYSQQVVNLRNKLKCEACRGCMCFVDPETGGHIRLDFGMVTKWAKGIVENPDEVSESKPPNYILYDLQHAVKPDEKVPGPSNSKLAGTAAWGSASDNPIVVDDFDDDLLPSHTSTAAKPTKPRSSSVIDITTTPEMSDTSESESDSESESSDLPDSSAVLAHCSKQNSDK